MAGGLTLVGLAYVTYQGKQWLKEKQQARLLAQVRAHFPAQEISVVYVNPQETAGDFSGGLVLTDGTVWQFALGEDGLTVEEESA
ncbi:hypothetical protein STRDD12_01284 [Streptococcus sp. DD12]|nr:hypothetical protein STRDD12_01284 [Streptococcus sp. DD12]